MDARPQCQQLTPIPAFPLQRGKEHSASLVLREALIVAMTYFGCGPLALNLGAGLQG